MSSPADQLPGFVMVDLFRNSLMIPDNTPPVKEAFPETNTTTTKKQWYLGDNKKNISILVTDPTAFYLADASLQFLSSILSACKLNLGDVSIINLHEQEKTYEEIKNDLSPLHVLLFDIPTTKISLPFSIPYYQVQTFDQCRFLSSPALQAMIGEHQEAKLEKSKLWLSLQKLFSA